MVSLFVTSIAVTAPTATTVELPPAQKALFDAVAAEEFCACDSPLTLAQCLTERPSCTIAQHLGRLVGRLATAPVTKDEVLTYLSERVMGPFCARPNTIDTGGAPFRGSSKAPITVIEFADFRCGHCKAAAPAVKAALEAEGRSVRLVFMPFPLQDHPLSVLAAEAALAADDQGKFWAMHDALFAFTGPDLTPEVLDVLAQQAGLDMSRFRASLADHRFRSLALSLKKRGLDAGVQGTPTFFVNGRPYEFDDVVYTFTERFAMERDRTRGKCK